MENRHILLKIKSLSLCPVLENSAVEFREIGKPVEEPSEAFQDFHGLHARSKKPCGFKVVFVKI
jgi:hypothetical protein